MRVGLVCPYSLDVPGGVQNHVRDLAEVLTGRGHDVGVLAPGDDDVEHPPYVAVVGRAVPVRYNGSVARVAFGPRVATRTAKWLRDGAFDLLHVHEPVSPSVSLVALWAAEMPVVATFHSAHLRSRTMSSLAAVLRPTIEKISARIAVSESARSTLVEHLGGDPVVIPNGLFCADFTQAQPRVRWQQPGPTIAFLGRTDEPRKGLDVLLRAFPAILGRHPTARLLVAGHGEVDLTGVPAAARRQVEILGQVTDVDRARLLSSATVYVAPQIGGESFGIVLVEAMAAGAPVVASALPAFRSVLADGDLGVLFATGDSPACASAVSDLLSDGSTRERLRDSASAAVLRYDWSAVTDDILAVYDTVLAARGRPRNRDR
ncbi:MAG: glycosyltransferase family 4 protein [Actinomycetota bacterium]|nr:glycosyltransferase family 4 protein [Actinomycetota bacterium]